MTPILAQSKEIVSVFPDCHESHIIHAATVDRIVVTYDLKQERQIGSFVIKNGTVACMSQRRDNRELVTAGHALPITFW